MKNLSDKLKNERTKRGLTQYHMAKLLHVTRSAYSLYETGKREPCLQTVRYFSAALNVYMGDLVTDQSAYSISEMTADFGATLSFEELSLLQDYRTLNLAGQQEALKRMNELSELSRYRKTTPRNR